MSLLSRGFLEMGANGKWGYRPLPAHRGPPLDPSYDKLYELKVDDDGTLVQPVMRTAKWKMRSVTPHRGDNGRIELFEIGLEKENV
jgi:hypothetical protein